MFGWSLSNICDINNDGISDIAVGSPHRHYFDAELSPIHILLLEKDGKVKYSETIPSENDTKINPEIYYFLGIPLIFVIFLVIIAKIKLRNSNQKWFWWNLLQELPISYLKIVKLIYSKKFFL